MTAINLNRISIVLGFVGFYIAALLSLEKLLKLELPCGASGGCSQVSNHTSAYWLVFPVAFVGALGWAAILALAISRASGDLRQQKGLVQFGLVLTGFGAIASVYLQFVSFTVIKAFCPYCFTQAVAMVISLVVHILMWQKVSNPSGADGEFASKQNLPLLAGLAIASVVGLTVQTKMAEKVLGDVSTVPDASLRQVELVPKDVYIYGQADAPITIVEFADICCPSCQLTSPKIAEFVDKYPGKVRWVYRHFLIPSHKMAPLAAAAAEYAGTKGKFYEFIETTMKGLNGSIPEEPAPFFGAARLVGLDPDEMKKALSDTKNPVFQRIADDAEAAAKLGVDSTPTFVVTAEGMSTKTARANKIFELLAQPEYKAILNGKK